MNFRLWALLALAACAYARTAQRQPSVSPQITSLTDKDAKHKGSVHPAFANAGRQAGVEAWRIKDFEPVPVPQKELGKFYKGDSYIILKTTKDNRNNLSWDIHYWIGSESSQDESGAAAILTVGLDDKFGGAAVQHRETLGHESPQFAGYFQPAIRYLDGGHASGFKHVTTNAGAEKRLFQVKGKRNVRVRQVDPLIASMNKGDVFILDVNQEIYVYVGEKAKNVEKLKAISMANQVRDQDHSGRGRVEIIDQYSSETDTQKFFTALGSGNRDLVPEESAGGDDQTFERSEEQSATLSEVSDSSGKLKISPLAKPYKQEQLKPQECYILDTVSGSIYVWVGKQATDKEKSEAMSKAQQYLSAKNYPAWVHVARIPQGTEPAVFKQYFQTWRDVGMAHSRLVRDIELQKRRRLSLSTKPALFRVSVSEDGVTFAHWLDIDQWALRQDSFAVLDTGEVAYVWVGSDAEETSRKSPQQIADEYLTTLHNDHTPDVRFIKQGVEPEAFTQTFPKWSLHMWQQQRAALAAEEDKENALNFNEIEDS